jgi:glutathione S-transferase
MTIELYVFPRSPRAFKVMSVANHLGIDHTLRILNAAKGEHQSPGYTSLNPNMRMPTLKDGDFVLWESNAILQYLAAKKPESGLLPRDEQARIDVTRWQFWDLAHWDPACAVFAFEYVAKPALGLGAPDAAAIAKATPSFENAARVLDGQLKGRKFVTGDTLTLADFSLGAWMVLAEPARYPVARFEEIKRWYGTLKALPAWQKTLGQVTSPAPAAA